MNKFLNWCIALLLPSLVACGGGNKRQQATTEEIYACPKPGDIEPEDEPTENDTLHLESQKDKI